MIGTLLVANRGEIACRIIRTARAMGLVTVAVWADPDADALHVEQADLAVRLPGTTAAETYLSVDRLLEVAARTGADAVHPGYGFLAERADAARAVVDAGLTWVGPHPGAIAAMGDKLAAKEQMAAAGVPVLPSVTDPAAAADLGFPLIVKAAAGGGGKGMRVVTDPAELDAAVAAARREAAAAFGDDRVFIEPFLARPRHLEVQVLGDRHGTVVHLGERECSLQRRHQKVVEETPSPLVDDALRARLTDAAVAAARAIGYDNAGTVEFVAAADGDLAFLEVNTRLQVEHPVTEEAWRVRGERVDLVRLQLLVAEGHPLPFGQEDVTRIGHAIEARLYAEDPAAGFLPATGPLEVLRPAHLPGTRWDTGVREGDEVGPFFDPLLAKVVATAPTRSEAVRLLAAELRRTRLHGLVTNRDALVAMVTHPAFLAGDLDTGFIPRHLQGALATPTVDRDALAAHAVAAALSGQHARRARTLVPGVRPGFRTNPALPQRLTGVVGDETVEVAYQATRTGWDVAVDGAPVAVVVHRWPDPPEDGTIDLEVEGRRLEVAVTALPGDRVAVDSPLGHHLLAWQPRFPRAAAATEAGGLHAPMPGTVLSVHVTEGETVAAGDLLVVLEAMKMEHRVPAPHDGLVSDLRVARGDRVATGDVLAILDPPPD